MLMVLLKKNSGVEAMVKKLLLPHVVDQLAAEPHPIPRPPESLTVSPSPAKAGAASRAQSKGHQASSTPTKVLKGCKAQSEDVAGPSEVTQTGQPVVGASRSLLLAVSPITVH